jgi:hypothetical protein
MDTWETPMPADGGYFAATRHPVPCLVFLLPLLLAYEAGVVWLGGARPESMRNGADVWLRHGLDRAGVEHFYGLPALVGVGLCGWAWWRRDDRPADVPGVCLGMVLESVALALVLWGLSRGLRPALDGLGVPLTLSEPATAALRDIVTFVGAGIYEEVLFRLLLFSGVYGLLRLALAPAWLAFLVAGVGSAVLFAGAHHLGPLGEPFDGYVFLFRSLAGLYFACLYQFRGFGVAVGAHACYDVLVGVVVG